MEYMEWDFPDSFEDINQDATEPTETQPVQEAETPTSEPVKEQANESAFEIDYKFDHADFKLTDKAEAQRLIQLGLYHEKKVQPEFDGLKQTAAEYAELKQTAEMYGMSVPELKDFLHNQYLETQATEQGVPIEIVKKEYELTKKEQEINSRQAAYEKQVTEKAAIEKFIDVYPNVTPDMISAETRARIADGMDMVAAYALQENQELKQQLQQTTQNSKNKATSPVGSATLNGTADNTVEDPLLEAFWGSN